MTTLLILYVMSGTLLVALAVPLLMGKVPPNPIYGFRLRATLNDPEVWYAVNAYSARWLIAGGLVTIAAAVGLSFVPGLSLDGYALGCLAAFVTVLVLGLILSVRRMNALVASRGQGGDTPMR